LLAVLRGEDVNSFSLTVMCSDGKWTVSFEDLEGHGFKGVGADFTEAWYTADPLWVWHRTKNR
jgi:hypothetical protein